MLSTKKRHGRCRHRQFGTPNKVFTERQHPRVGRGAGASRRRLQGGRRRPKAPSPPAQTQVVQDFRPNCRIPNNPTTSCRQPTVTGEQQHLAVSRQTASSTTTAAGGNGRRAGSHAAHEGHATWTPRSKRTGAGDAATSCLREKTAAARIAQIGPVQPRSGPQPGARQGARRPSSTTAARPPHHQAATSLLRLRVERREHHPCATPPKHSLSARRGGGGGAPPSPSPLASGRRHRRQRRRRQRQ
jgi:hypothetical protein